MLNVVATPLGNLSDLSPRAIQMLKNADLILAEDTRHSKKLCVHYSVETPLVSVHEHNEHERLEQVQQWFNEGKTLALISDAGTPAVSDPGALIVELAHRSGVQVSTAPGPSALAAALSVAGFYGSSAGTLFVGFLPAKGADRSNALDQALAHAGIVVLFEAPHRFEKLVDELAATQAEREVCVVRELSKKYESVIRVSAANIDRLKQEPARGEFTVVLGPVSTQAAPASPSELNDAAQACLKAGLSRKDTAKAIAAIFQQSKKEIYALVNEL